MHSIVKWLTAMTIIVFTSATFAQAPILLNYQGRLCDNAGNPVPDSDYLVTFSLFADSTGGTPIWSEIHPAVHTSNGQFNATLGLAEPWDERGMLDIPTPYLQIQVGTTGPLTPRTRITSVAHSVIAQRMNGDILTSDSSVFLGDAEHSINLNTGSETMGLVIEEQPADPVAGRRFYAGVDSGEVVLGFEGPDGQRLISASGTPGSLGSINWRMFNPQPEPPGHDGLIQMNVGADGSASFTMFNERMIEPGDEDCFEVANNPLGGASLKMFNPQPEPPGSDPLNLIELNTGYGRDAGIFMFNPQPEPPGSDPFFALKAMSNGPEMDMFAPQVGGAALVNDHPQIKLKSDSTASRFLFQRAYMAGAVAESTGFYLHADSIRSYMAVYDDNINQLKIGTDANGGYASFFDDGSEYMGVDPTPWHAGGDLTMYDATGGVTLLLASNGMASIGTGNHTNILTIQQYSSTDPIADAWTEYSSRRWKTNIRPLEGALDKVMRLNGVSFDWIENGKHDIGLIAEDVGKVVPEVVAYEENGVDARSVDYARLVVLLIEGMKEQQAKIASLEQRIIELETGNK